MNINIKYINLDSTAAIEKYIVDKIESLDKLMKRLDERLMAQANVEIARTTKHHKNGPVFRAECNLQLPGRLLRVAHEDWDVRRCVDEVRQTLERQIGDYMEKIRPQDSRGQKTLRKLRGK